MRLGQLSRQLEVSSDRIAQLLNDNFREVNNHPNVKLTPEELAFVTDELGPKVPAEAPEPSEPEPAVEAITPTLEEAPSEVQEPETEAPEFVESLRPQIISLEEEFLAQTEGVELYKAEKPHLEGLKVVGKIDLPEPVIKEKPEPDEDAEPRKTRDRKSNRRDRSSRDTRRNTPSLIEERKKAERLAKKRKFEEEQKLKELKKKHYEENVKAKIVKTAPKKKKKVTKEVTSHVAPTTHSIHKSRAAEKPAPVATNPLKRFWLWLNGAYDK